MERQPAESRPDKMSNLNAKYAPTISLRRQHDGPHLCYVITHPLTSRFLRGQLRHMRARGYQVTLISSPGKELEQLRETEDVDIVCVPMAREISPLRDLGALVQLVWMLWKIRPHIVNVGSPKAGLLALLAAFFARIPVRIYTLRGLRLETTRGLTRRILSITERIASVCAHRVICVSQSLCDEFIRQGLVTPSKAVVLGAGSSNGVNAAEFEPTPSRRAEARNLREQLGIAPNEPVIGYVGRLTRDKGTADLVEAFQKLTNRIPNAWLILVGEFEAGDALDDATVGCIRTHPRIISVGFAGSVAPYYHMMNVMAFPSYREGFPNAVLEAQASGIPVVGYRATGVIDAITEGVTGRLIPVGAVTDLADALAEYLNNPDLAANHGIRGRQRVLNEFSNERVWDALAVEYQRLLREAGFDGEVNDEHEQTQAQAA